MFGLLFYDPFKTAQVMLGTAIKPEQAKSYVVNQYKFIQFSPFITPHYKMDLDITQSCCGSHFFNHGILQKNNWKISYNSFVKKSVSL